MRTLTLSILLFLSTIASFGAKVYQIDLTIADYTEGQQILLARYAGTRTYVCDTAITDKKGVAIFEGNKRLTDGLYVIVFPDQKTLDVLIDNVQIFSIYTKVENPVLFTSITGAPHAEAFQAWQKEQFLYKKDKETLALRLKQEDYQYRSRLIEQGEKRKAANSFKLDSLSNLYPNSFVQSLLMLYREPVSAQQEDATIEAFKKKHQYWTSHYWDYTRFEDERLLNTPLLADRIDFYFGKLIPKQSDSSIYHIDSLLKQIKNPRVRRFTAVQILSIYQAQKSDDAGRCYVHVADKWILNEAKPNSRDAFTNGVKRKADQLRSSLPGMDAPDLNLLTREGKQKNLYSIKASTTALLFWDSDCYTCQNEALALDSINNALGNPLTIVAVYVHADKVKWQNFTEQHKLNWIHLYDPILRSNFAEKYHFSTVPALYLLDEKKKVIAWNIKTSAISTYIKK